MNNQVIEKSVAEMKINALKELPNIISNIYLYGSCARGDYNENSDIDVLIIIDCPEKQLAEYTDKLLDISDKISMENDVILSLQTSAKSEWLKNQKHSLYYRNILQEGKVYYG